MPFLQIFADQLSQTAASLPGANVKHPSSAAVWAYAHLDSKMLESNILVQQIGFQFLQSPKLKSLIKTCGFA